MIKEEEILSRDEHDCFPWGRVVDIHRIAEYEIVEFIPLKLPQEKGYPWKLTKENIHTFYVNGASLFCDSLDEAIVAAIAYKYEGINSNAARYFMLMIDSDVVNY